MTTMTTKRALELAIMGFSAGDEESAAQNGAALAELRALLAEQDDGDDPETRLTRLRALAEQCREVYQDCACEALESGAVPRYALLVSEGSDQSSYADNPSLSVHDSLDRLAEAIADELEQGWSVRQCVDLETGEDIDYTVKVTLGVDE